MAYENKIAIESCIKRIHEQQGTTEKVQQIINELETVYRKAKAYDDINKCLVEIFKQEEPLSLADEYERGLYNAYYEIAGIIQEHMERADDER
ncbi:hypothetical protein [Staphylococcus cohnii]|uniref:hypothetical protein n=1 Tax=Staphylococcus cohnii TaxID=29382 RepID=UPI000314B40B|nr:hypothetical protein [Staphylococcus cohnii]